MHFGKSSSLWFQSTSKRGWDSSLSRKQLVWSIGQLHVLCHPLCPSPACPARFLQSRSQICQMQSCNPWYGSSTLHSYWEVEERTVLHNFLSHQILQILISALDWGSWWLRSSDKHPIPAKIEVTKCPVLLLCVIIQEQVLSANFAILAKGPSNCSCSTAW